MEPAEAKKEDIAKARACLEGLFRFDKRAQRAFVAYLDPYLKRIAFRIRGPEPKEDLIQEAYRFLLADDFKVLKGWSASPAPIGEPRAAEEEFRDSARLSSYLHVAVTQRLWKTVERKIDRVEFDESSADPADAHADYARADYGDPQAESEHGLLEAEIKRLRDNKDMRENLERVRPCLTTREHALLNCVLQGLKPEAIRLVMGYKNVNSAYKEKSELFARIRALADAPGKVGQA